MRFKSELFFLLFLDQYWTSSFWSFPWWIFWCAKGYYTDKKATSSSTLEQMAFIFKQSLFIVESVTASCPLATCWCYKATSRQNILTTVLHSKRFNFMTVPGQSTLFKNIWPLLILYVHLKSILLPQLTKNLSNLCNIPLGLNCTLKHTFIVTGRACNDVLG